MIGNRYGGLLRAEPAFSASRQEGFHRDLLALRVILKTVGVCANEPSLEVVEAVEPQAVTIAKDSDR